MKKFLAFLFDLATVVVAIALVWKGLSNFQPGSYDISLIEIGIGYLLMRSMV